MKLLLNYEVRQTIEEDALKSYPHECCGFMYGYDEGDNRYVTEAKPVNNQNTANPERRFEISAEEYMAAELYADNQGLTLLGVYHSHPDHPAVPSEHDLRKALPYFSYIIVSVKKGKIFKSSSWILNQDGMFEEESIEYFDTDINKTLRKFLSSNVN